MKFGVTVVPRISDWQLFVDLEKMGYDAAWAAYSRTFRRDHPVCGERANGTLDARFSRCLQEGLTTPSACVDHIQPLRQNGSKWDADNHVALCLACNTWKANTLERRTA